MRSKRSFILGLALALTISPALNRADPAPDDESQRNTAAVLNPVLQIERESGKAIRLYFVAACVANDDRFADPVPFPKINVQLPREGKSGVDAIRDIFRDDQNVMVTKDGGGIVRIWVGKPPTDILQTKVPFLSLDLESRYNPNLVFTEIQRTKQMQAAMKSLHLTRPNVLWSNAAIPQKGLPHLPATIRDKTVEQILDLVAHTWRGQGLVIYGICDRATQNGERFMFLDYGGDITFR